KSVSVMNTASAVRAAISRRLSGPSCAVMDRKIGTATKGSTTKNTAVKATAANLKSSMLVVAHELHEDPAEGLRVEEGDLVAGGAGPRHPVDERHAALRELAQGRGDVVDGEGDVVEPATLGQKLLDAGVLAARHRRDELDARLALGRREQERGV